MNDDKNFIKELKEKLYTNEQVCAIIKANEHEVTFVFEQYEVTIKELLP